jgi:hypothetical protein
MFSPRKVGLVGAECELLLQPVLELDVRLTVETHTFIRGALAWPSEDPQKFENQVAKHWMSVVK